MTTTENKQKATIKRRGRPPKSEIRGRIAGGHNKGYWFRKGRGWYVTDGQRKIPLLDAVGNHLKAPDTSEDALKEAHARYVLGLQQEAEREATGDTALVLRVVKDYLDYAKSNNRPSTYVKRGEFLFDFCFGLPCRFWDYGKGRKVPKPTPADYLHKGYGDKPIGKLIPMDIQQWLDAHKGWGASTRRMAVQGVKRAFNYAVKMGLIADNPIAKFKVGQGRKRITYFTPKQEAAMMKHSTPALAIAIRVCIRTGVRYGSEFCRLTAKHIDDTGKCMVWRFSAEESKTGKPRVVYIPTDIAELTRQAAKRYPHGAIFRTSHGKPWVIRNLRSAFRLLKLKLEKNGVKLDPDACLYSTRHTYAKRMLGGYWDKPTTIELVAGLMGNSRQVCWDHYGAWCDGYTEPLVEAVLGL